MEHPEAQVAQTPPNAAPPPPELSDYRVAKLHLLSRRSARNNFFDILFIAIGIFSAGFGLKSFLLPNEFIDGGATGISLLLTRVTGISLSIFIVVVNLPFIALAYRIMGWGFTVKAILSIVGLALCLNFIDYPLVTHDKLLVAVFGGFFLGAGIGFAIRGGSVLDGTEVLAIYLSRKGSATIGDIIMIINVMIFSTAVYFLGIESALYSMLTYLSASKTVDFLIEGIEEYTGVTIISHKSAEIRQVITEKLGRGITVYRGVGGFGKQGYVNKDTEIIFTVVTRLEVSRLKNEISLIDEDAFIIMNSIKDTRGGMIKKRAGKH
jgi:uncharacterized membrane-anchored protein YitT (DUF2179 family)